MAQQYSEDSIKSLNWEEHIRLRPGMYIGKLGDGTSQDDGIYVLIKEIIDNSIDEFLMGNGKLIEISIKDNKVKVRDRGRGIPLGSLIDCVSKMNTGAKYDDSVFQKSVGLNGVGTKAVNALSVYFCAQSVRDGKKKMVEFSRGVITKDYLIEDTDESNGTTLNFIPDEDIFGDYHFISEYIEKKLWNYAYLNKGLTLTFNGQKFFSKNGLLDLLENNIDGEVVYPALHLLDTNFEFAFTHLANGYGEEYHSFVNGQNTSQGGTHQQAFREAIVKTIRDFYKKDFEPGDIRNSIIAAISLRIQEPVFESQTKTKLGSMNMEPNGKGQSVKNYISEVVSTLLDKYLHMNPEMAESLLRRILESEKERKDIAGIKKLAKDSAKKVSLHNKKLRDCRIHLNSNDERGLESTIFITEGDSASGSITKTRDVNTQAVFSLKGKPLNCFGESKKVVYENEEFNLLQAALNLEDGLDGLRYNYVVIATDADDDGMHIRLLLLTFFVKYYPDLVKAGHVYILQTPLFRVRNKQKTFYSYSEEERLKAVKECGANPEITRFKGLGEISPDEFRNFIGKTIRLDPVVMKKDSASNDLLSFYMGKNTPDRQKFIIENLRRVED
ncbi:MAG: DNA topoisomerase IV subunit B [Bacteroidota bacterium]